MASKNQPNLELCATTGDLQLVKGTMAYPEKMSNKLGIYVPPVIGKREVYALGNDPNATRFPCNETGNSYAMYVFAQIAAEITKVKTTPPPQSDSEDDDEEIAAAPAAPKKKSTRVGERDIAIAVMKREAQRLNSLAGYGDAEAITTRMARVYWHILKGFCCDGKYNGHLAHVMLTFVKIRLGSIPRSGDELRAAMMAFQEMHKDFVADSKFSVGLGYWTLPLVHLLNGHMIHIGATPIAFHQEMKEDGKVEERDRRENSKSIYVKRKATDSPKKTPKSSKKKKRPESEVVEVTVERRTDVVDEWIKYANKYHGVKIKMNPGVAKPVNPEPPAKKPKNALRGLTLDL